MNAYGVKGTWSRIRSANGPAQHVAISITGLIFAGMFYSMVHPLIVSGWAFTSFLVLIATVWFNRAYLKYTLLVDFVLSVVVLFQYVMYEEPQPTKFEYYTMGASGMGVAHRPMTDMPMTSLDQIAHIAALIWLCVWSLYLAELVHRQILEFERLNDDH